MKLSQKLYTLFFLLVIATLPNGHIFATDYDFTLTNDTTVNYTTGSDYVKVRIQLIREVKDKQYYFSTQGQHSFHLPDLVSDDEEYIKNERAFKKSSLTVTNDSQKPIPFSIRELEYGEGMYIDVPNYRDTTYSRKYIVNIDFSTHDYVKNIHNWTRIEYPALHKDTKFEQIHQETNTSAQIFYNLSIQVDNNIAPLAKIYPTEYQKTEKDNLVKYSFDSEDRLGKPVYLEFGTKRFLKFEMTLKTAKTDNLIPEKYSSTITALSTNIYELALPREFSENNQKVKIESIEPKPTKLFTDAEGNVIGVFEVPANKEDVISVVGYISVEQQSIENKLEIPNPNYEEYINIIKSDSSMSKYLTPTKYWEVNDPYIIEQANKLLIDQSTLLDVIKNDYQYIIDTLEYDTVKAKDLNSLRIGAKAALLGGPSVCMEYSDSMIALLRAQGIPSRAAFGYTNIDLNTEEKISHQWVQIWIPEYGWLSIDPSYESSNMLIGQNIQYALWDTLYNGTPVDIKAYSADNFDFDSTGYKVNIYSVDETSLPQNLLSYNEIDTESGTNQNPKSTINLIIKTTMIGKAMIIVLPIIIILILLISLISLIRTLIKRTKYRKASQGQ
jgi:transglutaminase-like putative cysteine protease